MASSLQQPFVTPKHPLMSLQERLLPDEWSLHTADKAVFSIGSQQQQKLRVSFLVRERRAHKFAKHWRAQRHGVLVGWKRFPCSLNVKQVQTFQIGLLCPLVVGLNSAMQKVLADPWWESAVAHKVSTFVSYGERQSLSDRAPAFHEKSPV